MSKRYVRIIGSKRQVEAARILVERLMHGNELTAALPNEVSTLALTSTTAAAGFAAAGGGGGGGGGDGGGKGAVEEEDDEEWEIEEREVVVPLDGFKRFIVAKGDRDKLVKEVRLLFRFVYTPPLSRLVSTRAGPRLVASLSCTNPKSRLHLSIVHRRCTTAS